MHRLRSILAASALFLFASSASAVTITLSEMSSDGTPSSALNATLTFTDLGSGQLQLDVTNPGASAFDINEVGFNLDGPLSLELDSPTSGWTLNGALANTSVAPGSIQVDGAMLGNYEFHLVDGVGPDPAQIVPGETQTFLFTYTGTLNAGILESNAAGKMVIAKFVEGGPDPECALVDPNFPTTQCPQGFNTEDSAFGASGSASIVPEPFTSVLLLTGLAGLLVAGRRRV